MIDVNQLLGTHDVLFITLDTLRFDVAQDCLLSGRTPHLASPAQERLGAAPYAGQFHLRSPPGIFRWLSPHAQGARQAPTVVRHAFSRQ
jgi:hypothetical protein